MLGMMSATAFLSMWICNTATTAMMVPIAQAILVELLREMGLEDPEKKILPPGKSIDGQVLPTCMSAQARSCPLAPQEGKDKPEEMRMEEGDHDFVEEDAQEYQVQASGKVAERGDKMAKGLLLCVCTAANIGGIATLTGAHPNILITQAVDTLFPDSPGVDFASWFFFGFPAMVLSLILAWGLLTCMFLDCRCLLGCVRGRCKGRCKRNQDSAVHRVIRKQYDQLGPLSFAEKVVLFHFVLLVLLWFFRDMKFIRLSNKRAAGWTYFFMKDYMTDASTSILVAIFLFFWPSQPPNFMCCRRRGDSRPAKPAPPILDWPTVHQKMPWSVLLLLGGGFAVADGVKASGMSAWMGQGFRAFGDLPVVAVVLIMCLIVAFVTEFTSNTSAAAIFLPILGNLAEGMCIHPYRLMVPATIACSFGFMLPVASPPNAIVFSYSRIKAFDMAKSGFMLNLICILVLTFAINTYGIPLYHLDQFPSWATCAADAVTQGSSALPTIMTTLPANVTGP